MPTLRYYFFTPVAYSVYRKGNLFDDTRDRMKKHYSTLTLFTLCLLTAAVAAAATLLGCYLAIGGGAGLQVLQKVSAVRKIVPTFPLSPG